MSSNVSANEPSTQAAVETLQDGRGSIKSLDAQKKIVEESRKAGVAAFVFNPNASPEEKAAQVRAVS